VNIDPVTGADLGNGAPDAVMELDWGGNHPQGYRYDIISLGKKPGLIQMFSAYGADFEELEGNGQIEILPTEEVDLGTPDGEAERRLVDTLAGIFQLKGSRVQDLSFRFWPRFEEQIRALSACLDSERQQLFFEPHQQPTETELAESYDTESDVYTITLDYLDAGRYQEAKRAMSELYPPDSREGEWKGMVDEYCEPGSIRAQLNVDQGPLCSDFPREVPSDLLPTLENDLKHARLCGKVKDNVNVSWFDLKGGQKALVVKPSEPISVCSGCVAGEEPYEFLLYIPAANGWRRIFEGIASGGGGLGFCAKDDPTCQMLGAAKGGSTSTQAWPDLELHQDNRAVVYRFDGNTYRAAVCTD
jgi:hypothetical protein